MKKLKKTLALILAMVMLISVVPFAANAETTASGAIKLSKVNGEAYDSAVLVRCGDTLSFDVSVSRDASAAVKAWAIGFSFDSAALVLNSVTWGTAWATYSTNADKGDYIQLGSVSTSNVTNPSEVVATLNFTVDATFTGATAITTGLGSNYIGINNSGTVSRQNIAVSGANLTVYKSIDKSQLKTQLEAAAALKESDYIPSKWASLASAVTTGTSVYADEYAEQTAIDAAAKAISDAIANLVLAANKTALQAIVNKANIELSKDCYTADSIAALRTAVNNATTVLDDDDAIQTTVDAQTQLVDYAINNLKRSNVTVKFLNADGTVFDEQSVTYGGSAVLPSGTPTKASDATYNYVFSSWSGTYTNVTSDVNITPVFSKTYVDYTITFVNYDGTELSKNTAYHYGDTVIAPAAPSKPEDDTYTYEFAGWTPTVSAVTESVTYTAAFTPIYKEYTIKFVNYDGSEISSSSLHWGDAVEKPAATPTKPADAENTYTFSGWSPEVAAVSGNATYTAQFKADSNYYTVKFLNYDGSVISENEYAIGDTITLPAENPSKPSDSTYYYTFKAWSPEVVSVCAGSADYTATFEPQYLDADYTVVDAAITDANKISSADYTSASYARITAAIAAVVRGYTIDRQSEVDAMANAINGAVEALVSTTEYDAEYAKCAAVNNDQGKFTVDSYNDFVSAMTSIGAKKDFNVATVVQDDVEKAISELESAYALLEAATLKIDGAKSDVLDSNGLLIAANTNSSNTALSANDGGAGISTLRFLDASGDSITNASQSIGTGCTVQLMQGSEVKSTKTIVIYGDINGDGQVSIADIALARKAAVSQDGFTAAQIAAACCGNATVSVDAVIALAKAL